MQSFSRFLLLSLVLPGCILTAKDQERLEGQGANADVDGDGVRNADDCNDRDVELGDRRYDDDCDGTPSADNCDGSNY